VICNLGQGHVKYNSCCWLFRTSACAAEGSVCCTKMNRIDPVILTPKCTHVIRRQRLQIPHRIVDFNNSNCCYQLLRINVNSACHVIYDSEWSESYITWPSDVYGTCGGDGPTADVHGTCGMARTPLVRFLVGLSWICCTSLYMHEM